MELTELMELMEQMGLIKIGTSNKMIKQIQPQIQQKKKDLSESGTVQ
jgi:hypothetical protein